MNEKIKDYIDKKLSENNNSDAASEAYNFTVTIFQQSKATGSDDEKAYQDSIKAFEEKYFDKLPFWQKINFLSFIIALCSIAIFILLIEFEASFNFNLLMFFIPNAIFWTIKFLVSLSFSSKKILRSELQNLGLVSSLYLPFLFCFLFNNSTNCTYYFIYFSINIIIYSLYIIFNKKRSNLTLILLSVISFTLLLSTIIIAPNPHPETGNIIFNTIISLLLISSIVAMNLLFIFQNKNTILDLIISLLIAGLIQACHSFIKQVNIHQYNNITAVLIFFFLVSLIILIIKKIPNNMFLILNFFLITTNIMYSYNILNTLYKENLQHANMPLFSSIGIGLLLLFLQNCLIENAGRLKLSIDNKE